MKAAFLVKNGVAESAFEWRETSITEPSFGEVVIKVEAFGLNFADVLARNGLYREAPPLPCVLGYDLVGRIERVGDGVDSTWIGKRVVSLTRFGAYSEYKTTPIIGCAEVPDNMPAYAACALGTQYATAFYSTSYVQNMRKGERALVHAATGGVGTALVQLLLARGCEVFATAGSDEKVEALRKLGVHAFNYRTQDYEKEIDQLLNGKRLHASFNSIAGTTFKKDMRLLGANGRLVLYGFAERSGQSGGKWATFKLLWNMGFMMPIMLLATSKSIIGVNMLKIADHEPQVIQDCLQALVQLWKEKTIAPVNGGEHTPEQLGKAHDDLEHRKVMGKAVVIF